jgi:type VI secretion system secreted protein Hcp
LALVAVFSANASRAAAAPPADAGSTRIEVVVDGFQNSPPVTFPALSFEGGIANTGSTTGGGGGAGKATLESLVLTKGIDGASPRLLEAAATGRHLRSVTVRVFQRAPRDAKETLVLEVTAVDVQALLEHPAASEASLAERVVLEAATVTFSYPLEGLSFTFGLNAPSV